MSWSEWTQEYVEGLHQKISFLGQRVEALLKGSDELRRMLLDKENEIWVVREINLGLAERVVNQSDLLTKIAQTGQMNARNLETFVKDRRDLIETLVRIADLVETQDFKQIQIEVTTAIDRMYPY